MGQSKIAVFRALLGSEDAARDANIAFERSYEDLIADGLAKPIDGAVESISKLRDSGIRVALTTGFSPHTQATLISALGWESLPDLVLAPGPDVRGRPYPDMILTALMRLHIDGVNNVAALGDTAVDVETARRAGARIAAGTLTGAHTESQLLAAGATNVVSSIVEFAELLVQHNEQSAQ